MTKFGLKKYNKIGCLEIGDNRHTNLTQVSFDEIFFKNRNKDLKKIYKSYIHTYLSVYKILLIYILKYLKLN